MGRELTQAVVRDLFDYHHGHLFWKKSGSGRIREQVGCLHHTGYIVLGIHGKQYQAHRIIFLWHYGYLPENEIDHINRNRSDNRIENLREALVSCNQRNRGNPKNNSSGVKGVWFDNCSKKWRAGIRIINCQKNLGTFKFKYEAVLTRLAAEQCLNWEGCDSYSPAYRYAKKLRLVNNNGTCSP